MTNQIKTLTILHYEDEPESVYPIPAAILNLFSLVHPEWIDESKVVYTDYIEEFVLSHDGTNELTVRYTLIDNPIDCTAAIKLLKPSDIALFDLMRYNSEGEITYQGIDLYREARRSGIHESRLFVLTGFPHLLDENLEIGTEQRLLKPLVPTTAAERLVALFPDLYREGLYA